MLAASARVQQKLLTKAYDVPSYADSCATLDPSAAASGSSTGAAHT